MHICILVIIMTIVPILALVRPKLRSLCYGIRRASMTKCSGTISVPAMNRRPTQTIIEEFVLKATNRVIKQEVQSTSTVTKPMVFVGKTDFGDYQCNIAMSLAKTVGQKPRDLAARIMDELKTEIGSGALGHNVESGTPQTPRVPVIGSMDVSGPGFINIHLSSDYLRWKLATMAAVGDNNDNASVRLGIAAVEEPERVVVDFSSPNIAKEMHVGHLRSTIIGDSICRILEFLGHDVLRLNHVGDWGTQFGMLICHLRERETSLSGGTGTAELDLEGVQIGDLVEFYKAAKRRFDDDPDFRDAAREEVVRLQAGQPDSLRAWASICAQSRRGFEEVYRLLGVRITERGESFYNPMLSGVLQELERKQLLRTSDGAQCVFLEGYLNAEGDPLPLMVQKSDGGFLYASTDLAAIAHRVQQERAQRLIYVTDAGQAQHFTMVFKAAQQAGFLDPSASSTSEAPGQLAGRFAVLQHVPFGLVLGEDGKKIKSRSGDSVKLRELLEEAMSRAEDAERRRIEAHGPGTQLQQEGSVSESTMQCDKEISDEATLLLHKKARILGLGAVKYADLSMHRESSYRFSFSKMLAMSGNTAPYMLYAYVRIRGIQRRAGESELGSCPRSLQSVHDTLQLSTAEERSLAAHLTRFHEVLLGASQDLLPNKLCDYIFELSQRFNRFYEACPVLHAESVELRASRILLCALTADTLKLTLDLLGIETLEAM